MIDEEVPLMLLPGMGADARMFRGQMAVFPQLQVATWILPEPREAISHYAERMVDRWKPNPGGVIGGASFGGVVALEMASLIRPSVCLLIGSLRNSDELRPIYRRFGNVTGLSRFIPALATVARWTLGLGLSPVSRSVLKQLSEADGRFLQWATRAILDWIPSSGISDVPVLQIHGQRDWIIPAKRSGALNILPGAGHLLSSTCVNEVNDFLRAGLHFARGSTSETEDQI